MKFSKLTEATDIQELESEVQALVSRYDELFGDMLTEDQHVDWNNLVHMLQQELTDTGTTDPDQIDHMMRTLCVLHDCDVQDLHDQFVKQTGVTPDAWIQTRLSST